jgi:hypothetical protein
MLIIVHSAVREHYLFPRVYQEEIERQEKP